MPAIRPLPSPPALLVALGACLLVLTACAPEPGRQPQSQANSLLEAATEELRLARRWNEAERYEKTEQLLEDLVAAEPSSVEARLALGLLLSPTEGGPGASTATEPRTARAEQLLNEALLLAPDHRLAHHSLFLHHEIGQQPEAVKHLQEVVRLDPGDTQAHYKLTKALFLANQTEKARDYAERSIELALAEGNHFEVQEAKHILGRLRMEDGEFQAAEELLKEAIVNADGTHWACAYQALGELYSRVRREPEAAEDAPKPTDSETPEQAYAAALDAYEQGDIEDALVYLDRAISKEPRRSFRVTRGLWLLLLRRYEDAEAIFRVAHEEAPDDPGPRVGLGHLGIIHRDYELAGRELQTALASWFDTDVTTVKEPGYFHVIHEMACLGMAWVFANRNRHNEALPYFDKVLHHRPDNMLGLLGKANSLIALNELDKAREPVDKVLSMDEANTYALAARATIQLHQGNDRKAEENFLAALGPKGTNYTCPYEGLGLLYLRQGRTDEAKKHFQRAIEINPDIEFKKYNGLARIYIDEGRLDEARRLLRRSIQNFPEDSEAAALLRELEGRKP